MSKVLRADKALSYLVLGAVALSCLPSAALAAGDPVKGKQQFKQCAICHNVNAGEPDKQGPNLSGVIGKAAATNSKTFAYSAALKASNVKWTDEALNQFIKSPSLFIPKTTMPFIGIPRQDIRDNIIEYMNQDLK